MACYIEAAHPQIEWELLLYPHCGWLWPHELILQQQQLILNWVEEIWKGHRVINISGDIFMPSTVFYRQIVYAGTPTNEVPKMLVWNLQRL